MRSAFNSATLATTGLIKQEYLRYTSEPPQRSSFSLIASNSCIFSSRMMKSTSVEIRRLETALDSWRVPSSSFTPTWPGEARITSRVRRWDKFSRSWSLKCCMTCYVPICPSARVKMGFIFSGISMRSKSRITEMSHLWNRRQRQIKLSSKGLRLWKSTPDTAGYSCQGSTPYILWYCPISEILSRFRNIPLK